MNADTYIKTNCGPPMCSLSSVSNCTFPFFFFSRLKDAFISYLETKDSVIPTELEELFPEDILLSQCIAAWRAAAALKRDRRVG